MPFWVFCKCGPDKDDEKLLAHPRSQALVALQHQEAQKRRKIVGLWAQGVALLVPRDLAVKQPSTRSDSDTNTISSESPVSSRGRVRSIIPAFGEAGSGQDPGLTKIAHIFTTFDENCDNMWEMSEVRIWWSACESKVLTLNQYEEICNAVGGDPSVGLQLMHVVVWYNNRGKTLLEAHFAACLAVEEKKKQQASLSSSLPLRTSARRLSTYNEELRRVSGGLAPAAAQEQPQPAEKAAEGGDAAPSGENGVEAAAAPGQRGGAAEQAGFVTSSSPEFNDLVQGLCVFPDLHPDRKRLIMAFLRGCQLTLLRTQAVPSSTRGLLCAIAQFMVRPHIPTVTPARRSKREVGGLTCSTHGHPSSHKRGSLALSHFSDNDYVLSDESACGEVNRDYSLSMVSRVSPFTASPPECHLDFQMSEMDAPAPPAYNSLFADAAQSPNHKSASGPRELSLNLSGMGSDPKVTPQDNDDALSSSRRHFLDLRDGKDTAKKTCSTVAHSPAMTEPQSEVKAVPVEGYDESQARDVVLWKPAVEQEEKPWKGDGISRLITMQHASGAEIESTRVAAAPVDGSASAADPRYLWVLEREGPIDDSASSPLQSGDDPIATVSIRCKQSPRHYLSLGPVNSAGHKRDASSVYVGSHADPSQRAVFYLRHVPPEELEKYAEDSGFLLPQSTTAFSTSGGLRRGGFAQKAVLETQHPLTNHVYLSTVRGGKHLYLSVQHYTGRDNAEDGAMWLVAHEWKNESAVFNIVPPSACPLLVPAAECPAASPGKPSGRGPSVASSSTSSASSIPLSEYVSPPRWQGKNPLMLQLSLNSDAENRARAIEDPAVARTVPRDVPPPVLLEEGSACLETERRTRKEGKAAPPPFPKLGDMAPAPGVLEGATEDAVINTVKEDVSGRSMSPGRHPVSGVSPVSRVVIAPSPGDTPQGDTPSTAHPTPSPPCAVADPAVSPAGGPEAEAGGAVEGPGPVPPGQAEVNVPAEVGANGANGAAHARGMPPKLDLQPKGDGATGQDSVPNSERSSSGTPTGGLLRRSSSSLIKGATPRETLRKASQSPSAATGAKAAKRVPVKAAVTTVRRSASGSVLASSAASLPRSGSIPRVATTLRKSAGSLPSGNSAPSSPAASARSPTPVKKVKKVVRKPVVKKAASEGNIKTASF